MKEYAIYFTRHYTITVKAEDSEQALDKALAEFKEEEANAESYWEASETIDCLGESDE